MYIVLVTMIFIITFCILQFQLVNRNNLMVMPMIQDSIALEVVVLVQGLIMEFQIDY